MYFGSSRCFCGGCGDFSHLLVKVGAFCIVSGGGGGGVVMNPLRVVVWIWL